MLIDQSDIASRNTESWHVQVLDDLAERLMPPSDFPCVYSQNAFRRELLRFSFVDAPDAIETARSDLLDYIRGARRWNGKVNTARPLIMAFSQQAVGFGSLRAYHRFGWDFLQHLHNVDPAPWPDEVSADPAHPFWSFCFDGMQLFINMSAPAHRHRKSRNLGGHLIFVINPRERFDLVAGDTPEGERVRNQIRMRCEAYDGQPRAPQLGHYQKGELEWPQYALPDRNEDDTIACTWIQNSQIT